MKIVKLLKSQGKGVGGMFFEQFSQFDQAVLIFIDLLILVVLDIEEIQSEIQEL